MAQLFGCFTMTVWPTGVGVANVTLPADAASAAMPSGMKNIGVPFPVFGG